MGFHYVWGVNMLDKLVSATTAFDSWVAMCDSMAGGYVPTIYGNTRRRRILIRMVRSMGYRVFGG